MWSFASVGDGFTGAGAPPDPGASLEAYFSASSSRYLRTASQTSSGSSLRSLTARRNGCARSRHALTTSTKSSPPYVIAWTHYSQHRSPSRRRALCQTYTCQRGSGSNRRPSQSHTPGESVGCNGKNPRRKHLKTGISRMTNFRGVLFWSIFRLFSKNSVAKFCREVFYCTQNHLTGRAHTHIFFVRTPQRIIRTCPVWAHHIGSR